MTPPGDVGPVGRAIRIPHDYLPCPSGGDFVRMAHWGNACPGKDACHAVLATEVPTRYTPLLSVCGLPESAHPTSKSRPQYLPSGQGCTDCRTYGCPLDGPDEAHNRKHKHCDCHGPAFASGAPQPKRPEDVSDPSMLPADYGEPVGHSASRRKRLEAQEAGPTARYDEKTAFVEWQERKRLEAQGAGEGAGEPWWKLTLHWRASRAADKDGGPLGHSFVRHPHPEVEARDPRDECEWCRPSDGKLSCLLPLAAHSPTPPTPAGEEAPSFAVLAYGVIDWCELRYGHEVTGSVPDMVRRLYLQAKALLDKPPATPEADGGIGSVCAGCERTLRERLRQLHAEILPLIMGSEDYREGYRDGLAWLLSDKPSPSPADGAEGLRTKLADAQRRLDFYHSYGQEGDGWCGEHEIRFQANASSEGDECQACRAKTAEAALADALLVIKCLDVREVIASSEDAISSYQEYVWSPEACAAFNRLSARRRA